VTLRLNAPLWKSRKREDERSVDKEIRRWNKPDRGKDADDAGFVVVVVECAVLAVAAMPRWISLRTSGLCTATFDRSARVMLVLRGAMATEILGIKNMGTGNMGI
jgi:hypothetical protein